MVMDVWKNAAAAPNGEGPDVHLGIRRPFAILTTGEPF
jgi:hypothetical protein